MNRTKIEMSLEGVKNGLVKVAFFTSALLLVSNVFGQYDAKAKAILDRVASKYESMKGYDASFTMRMQSPLSEIDETQKGNIKVSGAKYNLKLDKQEIIVDGKTMWTVVKDGEDCEVSIMEYEPEENGITPQNIYTMYQNGYKYVYRQSITEEGINYNVLDLSPEDTDNQFFKIRIVINENDDTIKGWKIFEKNGNRYTYSIKSFTEMKSFESGTFKFVKENYPKCEINDLR